MSGSNYYNQLNIPDYSEITIVKKAFRQLALKFHPDRNPDPQAAETFKILVKAYETIGNPELKQTYDHRLKLGLDFEIFNQPNQETERDIRKKWYAKMRQEQDAVQEVENITDYENSLKWFPINWRFILIGFLLLTGISFILSDWYKGDYKIAFGGIIFFITSLVLWNELYKYYWHKSLTENDEITKIQYDKVSYRMFLKIFFGGLILLFGLIKIKKVWHLHYFGKEIFAEIDRDLLIYSYNSKIYRMVRYSSPETRIYTDNTMQVKIRISTKEPEIWEYLEE